MLLREILLELILKKYQEILGELIKIKNKNGSTVPVIIVIDGQGAAFGSVLADFVTGEVRRTEIVYHVKCVLMNKEGTVLKALSLGTEQIVLNQVRKKSGWWFFGSLFLKHSIFAWSLSPCICFGQFLVKKRYL